MYVLLNTKLIQSVQIIRMMFIFISLSEKRQKTVEFFGIYEFQQN